MGSIVKRWDNTLPETNVTLTPEKLPSQKERIVFQSSIFRGELLNFGGVWHSIILLVLDYNNPHLIG